MSLNSKLTTAEISHLWNSYVFDSLIHNLFSYFLSNVEDEDIKKYMEYVISATKQHITDYANIFMEECIPVPRGILPEDVNTNASRLFSDKFYIVYGESLVKFAFNNFALSYVESNREDIRELFKERVDELKEVHQNVINILASKDINLKPPYIDTRSKIEFVENNDFFAGYLGEIRNLSSLEIKQLFYNQLSNSIGKALMAGFSRVASSREIKDYFTKGAETADKYVKLFSDKLLKEEVSQSISLDSEVLTYSGEKSPLSDRFMLNHTVFLNSFGIGNYGISLAQSQRRDLTAMYGKLIVEVGLYANKGVDLLINNKWLEQPPLPARKKN
ncbi:DUF3231 family protein [Clostridium sp. CX1]|uniref:DUF3231 family protein n=1 Tax=Clostridium sp. CX1 TaxID=2978346 RepID=UPI0021C008E6|nr:DUF3231 family protein [Clostridium sp. CX1]MCT8975216.1 DUF3231 family protein [Clostridium sp. CX1]